MDTYVPIIPDPKPDDIEQRFKHTTLTNIEDKPDYKQMCIVREELFCNAIAIKSTFRRKKHGHLGSVKRPAVYQTEVGQARKIPTSGGIYPTFSVGATNKEKKRKVAEIINCKTRIKIHSYCTEIGRASCTV